MERILIANRGEIASRIIRTVQQLGKTAIAVYAEADAEAPHCQLADAAFAIGPSPPQQSYLNIDALLDALQRSGATLRAHPEIHLGKVGSFVVIVIMCHGGNIAKKSGSVQSNLSRLTQR